MLTLQNILDSDSLSTLVAKLNANFSSIALSNGGPQGVRGEQGIPGLPGKQGATGPAGPVGATGPAPGIIPFAKTGTTVTYPYSNITYPTWGTSYNDLSYQFLATGPNTWGPLGPTGSGFAVSGQLYFDNNQLGWWKYLTIPDPTPGVDTIDGNTSEFYVESPFFDSTAGGSWTGPDWYFYPLNLSSITSLTQGVWTADKTNYLGTLTGSLYGSPATGPTLPSQTPYGIANARMNSKFGTVWISSFDGQTQGGNPSLPAGSGSLTSNDTSYIYYWDYLNGPRLSSGVDRTLFKMSVDGPQYFDMMKARGWRDTDSGSIIGIPYAVNGGGTDIPNDGTSTIVATAAGNHPTYFARPIYNVSIDGYAPITFFTGRNTDINAPEDNTTLGYLQFTYSPAGSIIPDAKLHLFTTRQNAEFYNSSGDITTVTSSSNTGEAIWDVRRFITSNQYLNMFPQDTEGFTSVNQVAEVSGPFAPVYGGLLQRNSWTATNKWKVFQGYHSVFTGQKVIENASTGNQNSIASIDTWIYEDRQSWYGTSIFAEKPDLLLTQTQQELVRSAGMMVDGKYWGWDSGDWNVYQDRVYIYTSNMVSASGDLPNDYTNTDSPNNALLSLPVAHFSGTRNVGIGTFTNDKAGMFEPSARMQVHSDWRNKDREGFGYNTNYTDTLGSGAYTNIDKPWVVYTDAIPRRSMKTAAFTIERNTPAGIWGSGQGGVFDGTPYAVSASDFLDWYSRGVFNDILMGAIAPPAKEYSTVDAGIETAMASYLRPTSGIRYESFNFTNTNEVLNANPARNYGWGFRGALRFGSSPYFSGGNKTTPTTDEIGKNANLQNLEYQLSISPLSYSSSTGAASKYEMISGIGVHNLYPRTRAHFYGKNLYQEFRFEEAFSPGSENPGASTGDDVFMESWGSLASNNQITIDFLGDSYWYNAGIYDYSYDYSVTPAGVTYTTQFTPNARNYPTKEIGFARRTKSTYHPTNNYATVDQTSTTLNAYQSVHGGSDNGLWAADKYIGFNVFRDLLGKGDNAGDLVDGGVNTTGLETDHYASNWRIGTEGINGKKDNRNSQNGGSLILTDSNGRMGFSFIPSYRDGGRRYGLWEQQNVGTREIVDNIKVVFDEKGNIGIGNAPGLDENAYPSQRYFSQTAYNANNGKIYYLPNANGAAVDPTAVAASYYGSLGVTVNTPWIPGVGDTYGYATGPVGSAYSSYDPAAVNAKVTSSERIRFEISGEKASTRVGHNPERRGYGYPGWSSVAVTGLPNTTATAGCEINITDNTNADYAIRYIGIPNSGPDVSDWAGAVHTFRFDNLGRLIYYVIEFASAPATFVSGTDLYASYGGFRMPHPRDFSETGPFGVSFGSGTFPWTSGMTMTRSLNGTSLSVSDIIWIPASAAAAELSTCIYVSGEDHFATATVAYDALAESVVRLNNFNLGDGYQLVRTDGNVLDTTLVTDSSTSATVDIFNSRTKSPKLLLTFGGIDYENMDANGITPSEQNDLINAGMAPLMKVTTVIESAQNETSVRTYTIPKADNTGGSFMVITDHMGQREKDAPGLVALPGTNVQDHAKIRLEKVTAHEVVRTGTISTGENYGFAPSDWVGGLDQYWDGNTLPTGYELLPINYIAGHTIANSLNTEIVMTDPAFQDAASTQVHGSNIRRDLDAYWEVDTDIYIGPFVDVENEAGDKEEFNKSEIRYRRLNENYVMFDFNIDLRALQFDTLRDCQPAADDWNNHGVTRLFFGELTGVITNGDARLAAYTHSPYAPGRLLSSIVGWTPGGGGGSASYNENVWVGIDARWVQYIRFSYDVQRDSFGTAEDPFFFERQFGGGPSFGNWNEYRAWYPGSAVVGPYVEGSVGNTSVYTDYQFGQAPNSAGAAGQGASGYNLTDGNPGAPYPGTTGYQWNNATGADGHIGTGAGFLPPRDGSPYTVWSSSSVSKAYGQNGIVRYWNGRLNDWFNSRWSWSNDTTNFWPNPYADSQANGRLFSESNKYTNVYNQEFGYAGWGYATAADDRKSWQNSESTSAGYSSWPLPWEEPTITNTYRRNFSYVNSYAYKMYWKWVMPFDYQVSYVGQPQYNLYVEHTKLFDDIISRAFGDRAWNRSAGMQWRVTPAGNGTGRVTTQGGGLGSTNWYRHADNVTFVVEVMLDEPIFVSGRSLMRYADSTALENGSADTVLLSPINANVSMHKHIKNQISFAGINPNISNTQKIYPFANLTLRGQSVVKYKRTTYDETTNIPLPEFNPG